MTWPCCLLRAGNGLAEQTQDTVRRIQQRDFQPNVAAALEGLSVGLRALIDAVLQVDPARRPTAEQVRPLALGTHGMPEV